MRLYRRPEDFDEDWAIRRALRRVIDPIDSRIWAMALAACFAMAIVLTTICMALWRISRDTGFPVIE
jgi:hypothetical protein